MMYKLLTPLFIFTFLSLTLQAQFSLRLTEEHRLLKSAISNYELGHYHQTQEDVREYFAGLTQKISKDLYVSTATFYDLLSSLAQKKNGSKTKLTNFLLETPYASLQQYGYFKMAQFLFSNQEYENAIPFYEKTDIAYLSNNEITSRNFELAYCYLFNNQLEKVQPLFNSIKDVQGDYHNPGNYYNGVVSYYKGDYTAALNSFNKVKNDSRYKEVVPFYIAELNYLNGNKDKAIQLANDYLTTEEAKYAAPMKKLLGQIYYDRKEYDKANSLLNLDNGNGVLQDDDLFRLGYTQYQLGNIVKSISILEKVNSSTSTIGAQSLYYLGLAYLKNGEKESALKAFTKALASGKLDNLKEDLSFNKAKLNYDLQKMQDAEMQLDAFVNDYPTSSYYRDAVEMLALLTIKDKNFDKAIASLNKLGSLTPIFQSVYQKANYARGIQMLKDEHPDLAVPYFNEALKYPVNEDLNGLTEFWKSECHYRLGKYYDALTSINKFIDKPGRGNNPALIKNASLSAAYVHMHLNDKDNMKLAYMNYLDTLNEISEANVLAEMDSIKPNYVPSHVPYVEANPYVFIYQLPSQNIDFAYKPSPLKPMAFGKRTSLPNNKNYIKAGFGNLRTPVLKVGYDLSEDVKENLYLNLDYRSSRSKEIHQQTSDFGIGLSHKKDISNYRLKSKLSLDRNVYRTYGMFGPEAISSEQAKIRYVNPQLHIEAEPIVENAFGIEYGLDLLTGLYNRSVNASNLVSSNEVNFRLAVPASKWINESTKANLTVLVDANRNKLNDPSYGPPVQSTSFVSLQPSIEKEIKSTKIFVGLYPTFGQKVHLLPNINVSTFMAALNSDISIGVESALRANSYRALSLQNPWITPNANLIQSKRTLFYASAKGSPLGNLNYNLKVGGGQITNLPLFVNEPASNQLFYAFYDTRATIFSFQAQAEYNINYNTNAGAALTYEPILSLENQDEAWHYVPMVFDVYAKYVYNNSLMLRADLLTRSGTQARSIAGDAINLKGAFDLNLQANYFINNRWSIFFEGNNLLNNKYQRWYNYPNFGLNVVAGFVYSFNKSLSTTTKNLSIK